MSKKEEERESTFAQEQEEESNKETDSKNVIDKDSTTQPSTTTVVLETQLEQTPADNTNSTATEDLSHLPENVRILKEAFPDIDVDVIEAILQIQGNSVDSSFEVLLGMSDPNYESTPAPSQQEQSEESTPPMPPRPNEDTNASNNSAPYAYFERQNQSTPISVEEQLRLDEEFAKKLAMEDEMRNERRLQRQQQQQQRRRESENDDDSLFNLQEELPIIKEKMREAGNAAKKKMMDFYNQIKANTRNNNTSNQHESNASSSIPTTNAQYRGLPSDDGDDLLTGDISALHLSDYDVYAQTGGRQKQMNDVNGEDNDIIRVNPSSKVQTSTSNAQLKADEDFARQLAEEERLEARRSRQSSNEDSLRIPQQQMPARKPATPTVVIAPRSPLEFEGDSDYEDIGLTAATNVSSKNNSTSKNTEDSSSVPYVIGDDDDSDSDDLVDIDEDELFDEEEEEQSTTEAVKKVDTIIMKEDDKKTSDELKEDDNNITETTSSTNTNSNTTTTFNK